MMTTTIYMSDNDYGCGHLGCNNNAWHMCMRGNYSTSTLALYPGSPPCATIEVCVYKLLRKGESLGTRLLVLILSLFAHPVCLSPQNFRGLEANHEISKSVLYSIQARLDHKSFTDNCGIHENPPPPPP